MIGEITAWILESMRAHGGTSVFVGVIIESVIVPIPSPLIIMGAGAILIPPDLGWAAAARPILLQIVLPGSVASTLGAFIGYGVGYWGGKPLIDRYSGFLGFSWSDIEIAERRMKEGNVNAAIFFLRALPVVPLSLVSAAIGVTRWPVVPFTLWTFLGSVPRCLFLGYLGWLMQDTYHALATRINLVETLVSGGIVAGACLMVLWLRRRVRGSWGLS